MLAVTALVARLTTAIVSRSGSAATAVTPSGRIARVPPLMAGGGSAAEDEVSKFGGLNDTFTGERPASRPIGMVDGPPNPPWSGFVPAQAPEAATRPRSSAVNRRQSLRDETKVVVAMEAPCREMYRQPLWCRRPGGTRSGLSPASGPAGAALVIGPRDGSSQMPDRLSSMNRDRNVTPPRRDDPFLRIPGMTAPR